MQIPPSKLKKFLSPSSDDELSEEQSPAKEEKNVHDSPNSCVIPPPLKPPRSWDLIQAGMIDDNTVRDLMQLIGGNKVFFEMIVEDIMNLFCYLF